MRQMFDELVNLYSQGAHEVSSCHGPITLFDRGAPFVSKLNELCERNPGAEFFVKAGLGVDSLFFIGIDIDSDRLIFKDLLLPFFLQKITENS